MTETSREYIDSYIKLVGEVNRALHSRYWWATDFSSKNRFNSRLTELLQKFLCLVDDKPIEGPIPWELHKSLNKHFAASGRVIPKDFPIGKPFFDVTKEWIKRSAASKYHFFRLLRRSWKAQGILKDRLNKVFLDSRPAYVIKTFVYDHSFGADGNYKDAFFGRLPAFLRDHGERVIFFAEILGDYDACLRKIALCPDADIIPVEYFTSWPEIFKAKLANEIYRPQLKQEVFFKGYEVSDLVNAEIAACSGAIQPYQFLHYAETRGLIETIPVKTFLMTYENNPWEKMCILALREFSKGTEIIGYQHTVNPQASVNMYISREEEDVIPIPDRLLTVGEVPQKIIERYTQARSLPVAAACALRYENFLKMPALPRTKTRAVLLALEGIPEVYHMVNFVICQLKGKDYKVILRTHPVLPAVSLAPKLIEPLEQLPFIEVSQGKSLMEDLARTDMTIYWGSTVSLESLWVGKPVIHFSFGTILSYDPLFENDALKKIITAEGDLAQVAESFYALSEQDFDAQRTQAREYLERYFYPVHEQNLAKFLPQKPPKSSPG